MLVFVSCKDDKESSATYDPNKPITLTNFYPTNGGVATKLILNGDNFGSDAKNIKVFMTDLQPWYRLSETKSMQFVRENRVKVMKIKL